MPTAVISSAVALPVTWAAGLSKVPPGAPAPVDGAAVTVPVETAEATG